MRRITIAIAAGWAVFVVATNAWLGFGAEARSLSDVPAYEQIALAAPGFPASAIPAQHAQRWPFHWAAGAISDLGGVSVSTVYWVMAFGAFAALVGVSGAALRRVSDAPHVLAIGIGLVAASASRRASASRCPVW